MGQTALVDAVARTVRSDLDRVVVDHQTIADENLLAATGRTQSQTSTFRAALINEHHLLEAAGSGKVRFTIPGCAHRVRTAAE